MRLPARGNRMKDLTIAIKGAGEMASGVAHRIFLAGMTRIVMMEIENPLCVRRTVSFCEALFEQQVEVEGVVATRVRNRAEILKAWERNQIAVVADPAWKTIAALKPDVVVDAILAKRNLGTHRFEAPVVIGIGPGFSAPDGVDAVIESNRGRNLGRAIYDGAAEPYTGVPASRKGFSWERVIRAPHAGKVHLLKAIGDAVEAGDVVLHVENTPVRAAMGGILRGLIREIEVTEGEKIGDIEPTRDPACCRKISDKAMSIGNGVLEAIETLTNTSESTAIDREGVRQWMLSARYARNNAIRV